MDPTDLIWMNGDFVAWEDAKVHVLTHGLHSVSYTHLTLPTIYSV